MSEQAEIAEAIYRVLFIVADLRRDIEIYRGFFENEKDAQVMQSHFPEIGITIRKSVSTKLITGCAALFTDKRKSLGKENLSIEALINRSASFLSEETKEIHSEIKIIVEKMNLKDFRNRRIAHLDYELLMNKIQIEAVIKNESLDQILCLSEKLLQKLSIDINYMDGSRSFFYSKIDGTRSPQLFLSKLSQKTC
jgi:hypothetical protein